MENTTHPGREVAAYVVVAYALALTIAVALPHANVNLLLSVAVPTVTVTVLTLTTTPRGRRRAVWRRMGLRHAALATWPAAVLVPAVLCLGAYGVAVLSGAGRLDVRLADATPSWAADLAASLVLGVVVILGEEIGWRGYLLPRVQELLAEDRRRAAVAVGFLHGCFHLPLILLATTYDTGTPRWFAAPMAVLVITAGGVFYAWVFDSGRSVWPVAIAHNTVNTVFDLGAAGVTGSGLAYVAGETGVATLGVVVVAAVVLWRRARVWQVASAQPHDRPGRTVLAA
jgi:uncharacterized protein